MSCIVFYSKITYFSYQSKMHLFAFNGESGNDSGMEASIRLNREKSYRLAEMNRNSRRSPASKRSATSYTTSSNVTIACFTISRSASKGGL